MHLFYTPDVTSDIYVLNEEESKHCIRVLRLTVGDSIQLIDGNGGYYEAEIIDDNSKRCAVNIKSKKQLTKPNWSIHIVIAPTKNMDRLEWFIEKATEIGIDEISFINCHNSERTIVKQDRLSKVAISAIKQSMKAHLPKINEISDFRQFLDSINDYKDRKFIAHCHFSIKDSKSHLKNLYRKGNNVLILIGPEGDFTEEEVKLATDHGFKEINLGASRLRTETAALYACTTINILNEE